MFKCDSFSQTKASLADGKSRTKALLASMPEGPLSVALQPETLHRSASIRDQIRSAIEEKRIVSPDVKFPERDFAEAKNFVDWCTSKHFLGQDPFLPQAVIATNIFAEYCPKCTDMDWFTDGYSVNDSLNKFRRKVALLENGVCPHCKTNRSELVKERLLNYYNEGAVSAGQRCVTGDTLVRTEDGWVRIDSFAHGRSVGFSPLRVKIWNGDKYEETSQFFIAEPEIVYTVSLQNGMMVTGTVDHPLYHESLGWKRIADLIAGDTLRVHNGETWSTSRIARITQQRAAPTYDFTLPETHSFIANGILSHNSGKSALLGMIASYLTHKVIKMEKPIEIYGVMRGQMLHGTFVALTYAQAKDTLWDPYYSALLESPWFQDYHAALDFVGNRYGEELYQLRDTFVKYRHRGLYVYPAGPDKRVLRGRTRFLACLTGDTLVSTSNGLQRIERDLYGQRTHVGSNHFKIVDWAPTGYKECFDVVLRTGNSVRCTANHELKTQRSWVRTDSLRKGDKIAVSLGGHFPRELKLNFTPKHEPVYAQMYRVMGQMGTFELDDMRGFGRERSVTPITSDLRRRGLIERHYYKGRTGADGRCRCYYNVTEKFDAESLISEAVEASSFARSRATFPDRMTPELASLLGYMIADGSYNEDAVEFFFASSIKRRLRHFKKCYKSVYGIEPKTVRYETVDGTEMTRYSISYQNVQSHLRYLGLDGVTAERKQIPWSILEAPKDCVAAFLAAAYDCDGGIHNDCVYYDTVSPQLARQMQIVLQRFGILSYKTVKSRAGEHNRKHDVLRVRIKERHYQELFKQRIGFSTNTLVLEKREYESDAEFLPDRNSLVWIDVVKRKSAGTHQVYDLTVDDEDHGFTADGLVVHNSIDELGWFPNTVEAAKNVKMNANEVYIALERSLLTVRAAAANLMRRGFYTVPNGYFVNISSPSNIRDKITDLVRQSVGSRKLYGVNKPTWEMNPKVTREDLEEEFKKDPVAAMRDYGAQPPLSSNPFITSSAAVEDCYRKRPQILKLKYEIHTARDRTKERYARALEIKGHGKPSVLALDAGYSNNSFAGSVMHMDDKTGKITSSLMFEVQPLPGIPINHGLLYRNLLTQVFQAFNIRVLAADRWNSLKLLSDAEVEFECVKVQHSLKYPEMVTFKQYIMDGEFAFPKPKQTLDEILGYKTEDYPHCFSAMPIEHFILQALTVQDTGSQVIKGENLTDDLFRANMLGATILLDSKYAEFFDVPEEEAKKDTRVDVSKMVFMKTLGTAGVRAASMPSGAQSPRGFIKQRR